MPYSTDEILEEIERARRRMPAPAYENHPFTRAINGYAELEAACAAYKGELELIADELGAESPAHIRDAIRALHATIARLRAACELAESYLVTIAHDPNHSVIQALRAALADGANKEME